MYSVMLWMQHPYAFVYWTSASWSYPGISVHHKNESLGSPGPSGQQLRFQAVMAPGCERHPRRRAGALATLCCLCEAASAKPPRETVRRDKIWLTSSPASVESAAGRAKLLPPTGKREEICNILPLFIFLSFHLITCTVYTIAQLNRSNRCIFIPLPHDVLTLLQSSSSISAPFYLHAFAIYLHHCIFANA